MSNRAIHRGATAIGVALLALAMVACAGDEADQEAPLPTSQADATQQYADCLESRGWDVDVEGDAVRVDEIPNEDAARYDADVDACHALVLDWSDRLSAEQWQEWYDLAIEATDCLEAAGYTIEDVPSLQRFTDLGGSWSPFDQLVLGGLLQGPIEQVEQQCPQPQYWPSSLDP